MLSNGKRRSIHRTRLRPVRQDQPGMTMSEFKFIYFWEYIHRFVGTPDGVSYFVIPVGVGPGRRGMVG